jgi:hypothetical protein
MGPVHDRRLPRPKHYAEARTSRPGSRRRRQALDSTVEGDRSVLTTLIALHHDTLAVAVR